MYKSNINLNLYKTFYDVAKWGSISKAAEYSYSSQHEKIETLEEKEKFVNWRVKHLVNE